MSSSVPSATTRAEHVAAASRRPHPLPRPSGGEATAQPAGRAVRQLPPVHASLICVALPGLAISAEHGQLTGHGLEGIYQAGRRLLSRCHVRVAGREPLAVQGRLIASGRARFVAVVRHVDPSNPDPVVTVERIRDAGGTERITLHSAATRPLRLPVEVSLATDLAELGAVASGAPGPELPASVYDSGLRWSSDTGQHTVVAADPPPQDALASAGLLRWDVELPAGGSHSIELSVRQDGASPLRPAGRGAHAPFPPVRAEGDDPRVPGLLSTSLDDLQALLLRDPAHPADLHPAAGAPWRCGLAPAEALAVARMTLPLGTRLAAGTLRTLARTQLGGDGPDAGLIPGPLRDAGPHLPPSSTGVEATLLFPVLLAEARRWGLPDQEARDLLPTAERCLRWLRSAVGGGGYLADPAPGGLLRCETQAHAHRAALLGADLLELYGRPGAPQWRDWAGELRAAFRREFWIEDRGGGRPAAARTADGRLVPHLGSAAAHLLDTGLLGGGAMAPGLLDPVRTEQLARLFGSPALDSGWGLRSLGVKEAGHNPFGHRGGAVRVHDSAVAVAGLAAAGFEKEAGALMAGVLAAAEHFGGRLPEMYAGEQRVAGGAPLPHPAACRPAAASATAVIHVILTQVGIRPDAVAGTVSLVPMGSAPLGELSLTGLRVAESPFAVRISRLGLAMIEEAGEGLQLGVRTGRG
ncbi:glycogen debranching N-terminal domain-containing protein [Streptomyces indicus]|uniref:Glycogen debranching enzyme (Alpha-1,6-glucosidase) n=1 Tax=Streptomyces indicus TaxID=417292 RepID=A0A1G9AZ00_9ACTN|nr:glycogen debranching N-terminal domain-containing protein [Streptomyces indicus]SDK32463.1 Glycogen debranching enzyme (alpha-1,6-glucosidase) [Streptomyces indicus]